jgi:hypothetical protein
MRNTPGGSTRRSAMVAALALFAFAPGCATGGASPLVRSLRSPLRGPTLVVENAGVEPVKLYLSERGAEWFVGYILPGRTEALPLPTAIGPTPAGRQFALVIVPSTATRSARSTTGALPGTITSEPFNADYLTSMRWKVVGRWVVALPEPIWP